LCQYDNVGRREQNEYLNKKRLPIAQLIKNKGISDGKKKLKISHFYRQGVQQCVRYCFLECCVTNQK